MPVDTSIYNALLQRPKSVAEYDAEARAAQQDQMALQMNRNKLAEYQRGVEQENKLADVYRSAVGADGKTDRNALYTGAAAAGLGARLPGIQKGFAELDETAAKTANEQRLAKKAQFEQARDQLSFMSQVISAAKDPASYAQGRQMMAARGMDVSQIPEQYDPAYVAQAGQQTLTMAQRLEQVWKDKNFHLDEQKFGETVRNNKEQTAVQVRGQNVSAATAAAGRAQADRHFVAGQAAGRVPTGYRANPDGTLSPIKGGPADPDALSGKMTEDQGKATGWLVQAENAYKNMMKVGRDANGKPTSAAKPGFNDALEAVPGMGGLANSMRGADRQQFMQSSSSLSEALLRAATGAGVNRDEAAQKVKELTPQFGEAESVTQQKYAAIPLYIESLKVRAGPGAKKAAGVINNAAPAGIAPGWSVEKH